MIDESICHFLQILIDSNGKTFAFKEENGKTFETFNRAQYIYRSKANFKVSLFKSVESNLKIKNFFQ
jgi:hypothetical protein